MTGSAMSRQQQDLVRATERQRLLGLALDFIGTHKRPITELVEVLGAIDQFLCPAPSTDELMAGIRRLCDRGGVR